MPLKFNWTAPADAELRRLRAAGATWNAAAAAFHVSRSAVIEHGRRIGARRPAPAAVQAPTPGPANPTREPFRAGHAATWTAITAGTLLAGVRYPWPPPAAGEVEQPAGRSPRRAA